VSPHRGERNDDLQVRRHLIHLPPLRLGDYYLDFGQPTTAKVIIVSLTSSILPSGARRSPRRAGARRARSPALSTVRATQTTSSSTPPTRRTPSAPIMPSTSPLHRDHPPRRNQPDPPPRKPMLVSRVQAPLHHPPVSHPFAARRRREAPALQATEHPDDEPCGPGLGQGAKRVCESRQRNARAGAKARAGWRSGQGRGRLRACPVERSGTSWRCECRASTRPRALVPGCGGGSGRGRAHGGG
jgi:hypothetical protein